MSSVFPHPENRSRTLRLSQEPPSISQKSVLHRFAIGRRMFYLNERYLEVAVFGSRYRGLQADGRRAFYFQTMPRRQSGNSTTRYAFPASSKMPNRSMCIPGFVSQRSKPESIDLDIEKLHTSRDSLSRGVRTLGVFLLSTTSSDYDVTARCGFDARCKADMRAYDSGVMRNSRPESTMPLPVFPCFGTKNSTCVRRNCRAQRQWCDGTPSANHQKCAGTGYSCPSLSYTALQNRHFRPACCGRRELKYPCTVQHTRESPSASTLLSSVDGCPQSVVVSNRSALSIFSEIFRKPWWFLCI